MAVSQSSKFGIVGNKLYPLNEAYANQMAVLAEKLNAPIFTCNDIGWRLFIKKDKYYIINSSCIEKGIPLLAQLNGVFLFLALKMFERRFDTIILSAGIESRFLRFLDLSKCIPIISTVNDESAIAAFIDDQAPHLKRIIVQSKKLQKKLLSAGIPSHLLRFCYPFIEADRFLDSNPSPVDEFRILFASAPTVEEKGVDNFQEKGVPLLLRAFHAFINAGNRGRLTILWRDTYNQRLYSMIHEFNLMDHVEIINHVVEDMKGVYARNHVLVLPFTSSWRTPEIPLSGIEALFSGRPLIVTPAVELAEIVKDKGCGVLSKQTPEELMHAFLRCKRDYHSIQKKCRPVAENMYSSQTLDLCSVVS